MAESAEDGGRLVYPGQIVRNRRTGAIFRMGQIHDGEVEIVAAEIPCAKSAPHGWLPMVQLMREYLPYAPNGMPMDRWSYDPDDGPPPKGEGSNVR